MTQRPAHYRSTNELPGPAIATKLFRDRFHRPQHLQIHPDGRVRRLEQGKCGIGGDKLIYTKSLSQPEDPWDCVRSSEERHGWSSARGSGSTPAWIRGDRQVLRFFAYFSERDEDEGPGERIRRCVILHYLEDESTQVVEPRDKNSGIPQGTLVRRHRIPVDPLIKPAHQRTFPARYVTLWDLNVSRNITLYGRKYRLVDCDNFTREYLERLGVAVEKPEAVPDDHFANVRSQLESTRPLRPYKRVRPKSSNPSARHVILRFFGRWIDLASGLEEKRYFRVLFYTEDDTVEVLEDHQRNCGRYKAPVFLKRGRLPKSSNMLVVPPGSRSEHTLLNVVRSKGPGRVRDTVLIDNLEGIQDEDKAYYTVYDFELGASINVMGRDILLYDCDEVTRDYLHSELNKVMEALELEPVVPRTVKKEVPPYHGFGTEEDSFTSCNGLEPRPPQRDFHKFMHRDRQGFESHVLRFCGRLITDDGKVDTRSKFVISYFLSDDTILINQIPDVNAGIAPGRFLSRRRLPKGRDPDTQEQIYFSAPDLYVGAIVKFNQHTFLLTEADEYVFSFMEKFEEREKYPHSNVRIIMKKLDELISLADVKAMMASCMDRDPEDTGLISETDFRAVLQKFIGFSLSEHQIITLIRNFRQKDAHPQKLPTEELLSLLQAELKRLHFFGFSDLLNTFRVVDVQASGVISKSSIRHTLIAAVATGKGARIKYHSLRDIIDAFLDSLPGAELSYEDLVLKLDWHHNPVRPIPPKAVPANFFEAPIQNPRAPILYRSLIKELEVKKEIIAKKTDEKEDSKEDDSTEAIAENRDHNENDRE